MSKTKYITTTLPYVNADPHIGFALEIVQADSLARFWRLMGDDVFFSTGTDEHGQKIFEKAKEAGKSTQDYVDKYAEKVKELKEVLNLSYDNFIRTTNSAHIKAAQKLWNICDAQGDIYKKRYKGLYCVGCEKFMTDKEIKNNQCLIHVGKELKEIEEENYFFALSKYSRGLLDYLSKEGSVNPEHRQREARIFVEQGLEDFSISRDKSRMPWGISVPGDDSQVMYVWFDALANYISTLGWPEDKDGNFNKFWRNGNTLQVAGKDQVRFQSIMWQAMLMSANLPTTRKIFYHGFITSKGQKMSKSVGNIISPFDMVDKYGTDATRYILLRHIHPTEDTDVTWGRMDEWYTANLVNGLGNLIARIMKLSEIHLSEPVKVEETVLHGALMERGVATLFVSKYTTAINEFRFNEVLDFVWGRIQALDQRISETEPFKLVKTNKEKALILIQDMVLELYTIAYMLHPFLPEVSGKIKEAVLVNKKPTNIFEKIK